MERFFVFVPKAMYPRVFLPYLLGRETGEKMGDKYRGMRVVSSTSVLFLLVLGTGTVATFRIGLMGLQSTPRSVYA